MSEAIDTAMPETLALDERERGEDVGVQETIDSLAGVPELLAKAIRRRGYTELTSVQRAVVNAEPASE